MAQRWEFVNIPNVQYARINTQVPVITSEGQQVIVKVPLVVTLDELEIVSAVLVRNSFSYTVQPIEEVDSA